MIEVILAFLFGVSLIIVPWCCTITDCKYCNRNYNYGKNSQELKLKVPEYVVKKVEQVYCKNDITACAKYTLQNWHIKRKNDIEMQELYLYDEIGKYNIGDILVFSLKQ